MSACPCLQSAPLRDLVSEIRRRCRDRAERATIRVGDAVLDVGARWVSWRGREVALTVRECDVLVALAGAHPTGLTGPDLAALVWGDEGDAGVNLARCYVRSLRLKVPGLIPYAPHAGHRYRIAPAARKESAA